MELNELIYVNARAIVERTTDKGREVLVQTRARAGERQQIELPGGQVELYESLVSALRREVEEETGLTVTEIEGLDTRMEVTQESDVVEVLRPFAVYQTLKGPVDSMGVYFRCRAEGNLLPAGDGSKNPRWVSVEGIRDLLESEEASFTWVDRAGLSFYVQSLHDDAIGKRRGRDTRQ